MDAEICQAWIRAGEDLGIRVVAPFSLATESGETIIYEAHILDFGGPKGTVIGNKDSDWDSLRRDRGYYSSNLYPSYRRYDRQHFIDTLNDWVWFGQKGKEPSWYTGKPWS
jgi:hypothetical protein